MDQATKDYLGYADEDNGEWWMEYDDFIRYFHDVTVCSLGPDFDGDGAPTGDRFVGPHFAISASKCDYRKRRNCKLVVWLGNFVV